MAVGQCQGFFHVSGWSLVYEGYDPAEEKSELVIVDASNVAGDAVARVHLPTRVPFGFHGSWISDAV